MTSFSLGDVQHNIFPANSTLRPAHQHPKAEARMHFSAGLKDHSVSRAADTSMPCSAEPCLLAEESVCHRLNHCVPPKFTC